jgi:hypothetical protein
MGQQVINTIFKFKRSTAANWVEKNPVLERGEPGFEIDTGLLKIGNGINPWTELKYVGTQKSEIESQINDSINDFAQKISQDGTVNTFKELVDYAAEHNLDYVSLLDDIEVLFGLNEAQAQEITNGFQAAKEYTDQKTQVQIRIWEDDD